MKAAWDIFDYERRQHIGLLTYIQTGNYSLQPLEIRNGIVEAAIIHLRIMLEMLKDAAQKPDDYCLTDLIAISDKPAGLPELMTLYSENPAYSAAVVAHLGGDTGTNMKKSPKWQIDKLMFHPTNNRTTSHDWTPILKILGPKLVPVIADLEQHAIR